MPRRILIVFLIVVGLVGTVLALLAWRGDELLRRVLERQVQSRLVPTVVIDGPIEWRLVPHPTVVVRNLHLKDAAGGALIALRELVVVIDRDSLSMRGVALASVELSGLEVWLRRTDHSGWDAAAWLRAAPDDADMAAGMVVPVGHVRIAGARVHVDGKVVAVLEDFNVDAGPFGAGLTSRLELRTGVVARTPLATRLQLRLAADLRRDEGLASLEAFEIDLQGRVADWELAHGATRAGRIDLEADGRLRASDIATVVALSRDDHSSDARVSTLRLDGQVSFAELAGAGTDWRGAMLQAELRAQRDGYGLDIEMTSVDATLHADGWRLPEFALELASSGAAPVARLNLFGDMVGGFGEAGRVVALRVAQGHAELPHPAAQASPLSVSFNGHARFDVDSGAGQGDVVGQFDQSRFDGRWGFDPALTPPLEVDLELDRLDLDRYLPPATAGADAADLAMWRNWPVRADLRIDALQVQGFVSTNARLRLEGRLPASGSDATSAR